MTMRIKTNVKQNKPLSASFGGVLLVALLSFACTPRAFEKPNANVAAPVRGEQKPVTIQDEVEKIKTAKLQFVFVFRRRDGGVFDSDDKKFLRANLPFNNRVVSADEDKAFIVGSNYKFPPENIEYLRTRFNLEDFSTQEQAK